MRELKGSVDNSYDQGEYYQETLVNVWENCMVPSVISIIGILFKLIVVNLCFGAVSSFKLSRTTFHVLSGLSGVFVISVVESTNGKIILISFFIQSYFLLHLGSIMQNKYYPITKQSVNGIRYLSNSNVIKVNLIIVLVLCEYYLLETKTWMEMRGIIMIFSMKLISLTEDIDNGVITFPKFWCYFGYVFCGANIIFGPWISIQDYINLYHHPTKKSIWWLFGIIKALLTSIFFLLISNCWADYFIGDYSNKWLVAYRDAMSFRTSHYFICYLSEASMLAAGFKNSKIWNEPTEWRFPVTNPTEIEFPTALAVVVTNWNRPMHEFLKKYIYKSWLPLGKFYGILATFIASSFLHGFELKVSVVLISIGVFSYLQFTARNYLAEAFDCCIRVYSCKETCVHKFKRNSLQSRICLILFSLLTVLHLIYLGVIMDPSTDEVGIYKKWDNLNFISIWVMISNILIII